MNFSELPKNKSHSLKNGLEPELEVIGNDEQVFFFLKVFAHKAFAKVRTKKSPTRLRMGLL
jgi:hypothetical protein